MTVLDHFERGEFDDRAERTFQTRTIYTMCDVNKR